MHTGVAIVIFYCMQLLTCLQVIVAINAAKLQVNVHRRLIAIQ